MDRERIVNGLRALRIILSSPPIQDYPDRDRDPAAYLAAKVHADDELSREDKARALELLREGFQN